MKFVNRLKLYCNQEAQLERKTGNDRFGNPTYEEAITIKVRKENTPHFTRNSQGDTVVSNATVFSFVEIKPMDKIDGVTVMNVSDMVDRQGNIIGWGAYL